MLSLTNNDNQIAEFCLIEVVFVDLNLRTCHLIDMLGICINVSGFDFTIQPACINESKSIIYILA